MRFFKRNGKQYLDMKNDLVITRGGCLVEASSKSASVKKIINYKGIKLKGLGFFGKVKATFHAVNFIWSDY